MGKGSEDFFEGIGCLIVAVATIMSIASIPFLGPIPIAAVFGIGYAIYRSKGRF